MGIRPIKKGTAIRIFYLNLFTVPFYIFFFSIISSALIIKTAIKPEILLPADFAWHNHGNPCVAGIQGDFVSIAVNKPERICKSASLP